MYQFSANISFLFKEYPLLDRINAAADAGFEGVEILFPYEGATSDIVKRMNRVKLPLVSMNTPPPNWTGGARGFAATPGGEDRFRSDFRRAMRFAGRLRPKFIHVMCGNAAGADAHDTLVANLKWAAQEAPDQMLTIAPYNETDMPDYFLKTYPQTIEILSEVHAHNLDLQFDTYHAHMITGDVIQAWQDFGSAASLVQLGGAPTRHEPQNAAFDLGEFYEVLNESAYSGFISGAYSPAGRTHEGLGWMKNTT